MKKKMKKTSEIDQWIIDFYETGELTESMAPNDLMLIINECDTLSPLHGDYYEDLAHIQFLPVWREQ